MSREGPRANVVPDPIVHGIAEDGSNAQEKKKKERTQTPRGGNAHPPRREKERIARQKRRYHQPRLAKDNYEEDQVRPDAIIVQQGRQMPIEVYEQIPCR